MDKLSAIFFFPMLYQQLKIFVAGKYLMIVQTFEIVAKKFLNAFLEIENF